MEKPGFTYGHDAVLLAGFARIKKQDKLLDLGVAAGILAVLLERRTGGGDLCGGPAAGGFAPLTRESARLNGQAIHVLEQDLRILTLAPGQRPFDAIVCNPPYFAGAHPARIRPRRVCTHQDTATIQDVAICAGGLLKHGGRLFLCYPAGGVAVCMAALMAHGLSPKRLQPWRPGASPPILCCWKPARAAGRAFAGSRPSRYDSVCIGRIYGRKALSMPHAIGNLEDITLRVIHTLEACQAIYCEDTRRTGQLLRHLGIQKPLVSCHAHNEAQRGPGDRGTGAGGRGHRLCQRRGDAGHFRPGGAADPALPGGGSPLRGICPGPSASLTALVASGLPVQEAVFVGFLPRSGKERREWIARLGPPDGQPDPIRKPPAPFGYGPGAGPGLGGPACGPVPGADQAAPAGAARQPGRDGTPV